MIARFAVLVVGVLALSVIAWYVNDEFVAEPEPRPTSTPTPSQADRLMTFCDKPRNQDNALCTVDPNDSEAVKDAVERIIEQQRTGPQIIERERITERDGDDSDDSDSPDVRVIVPSSSPTRAPASPTPTRTTQPPIVRDIVIPDLPELPPVELPELPLLNP